MKVSAGKHHDIVATTCIKFLTLVVGKQIHKDLFGSEATLTEIIQKIAIPNITMRAADEELFEVPTYLCPCLPHVVLAYNFQGVGGSMICSVFGSIGSNRILFVRTSQHMCVLIS